MKTIICILLFNINSAFAGKDPDRRSATENLLVTLQDNYKPQVSDGLKEPDKIFKVELYRSTPEGIDYNKNKIRDDVELFINRKVKEYPSRIIFREYSKIMFELIKDHEILEAPILMVKLNTALEISKCFGYLNSLNEFGKDFWNHSQTYEIEDQIFNGRERTLIFSKILSKAGGTITNAGTVEKMFLKCPKLIQKKYPLTKRFSE